MRVGCDNAVEHTGALVGGEFDVLWLKAARLARPEVGSHGGWSCRLGGADKGVVPEGARMYDRGVVELALIA